MASNNNNYNQNLIQNKRFAIIGAGPSGLPLARLLLLRGAKDVKVYERDTDRNARIQGGTLDLHVETGQLTLKECGLYDEFLNRVRPNGENHVIMDKNAKIHFEMPEMKCFSSRPEIDRADLRDIFIDALEPDTVQWNHHLVEIVSDGNSKPALLKFKDGKQVEADIVIGADGYNSKIRKLLTPVVPAYTGVVLIQADIDDPDRFCPRIKELVNGGMMMVLDDCKTILVQQKSSGSLVACFSKKMTMDQLKESRLEMNDNDTVRQFLMEQYRDWNPMFIELITEGCKTPVSVRPMYATATYNEPWQSSGVFTILGDAAHLMPPFAGEGANMAMKDALDLVNELTSHENQSISDAFNKYEAKMIKRTNESGYQTDTQMQSMHTPDAIDNTLRTILPFGLYHVRSYLRYIAHIVNYFYDIYSSYFKKNK